MAFTQLVSREKRLGMEQSRKSGNCNLCGCSFSEITRNHCYVFYACGCESRHASNWSFRTALWSFRTALIDGVEYELDTASSIVHKCKKCKKLTFREKISNEVCLLCGLSEIEPVKFREKEAQSILGQQEPGVDIGVDGISET
jgi:hypothetical protein